jgi:hypothetical protein
MALKLIEGSLSKEPPLDGKTEIADPTLHPKSVAIRDDGYVCGHCVGRGGPVSWEKVLEAAERRSIASAGTLNKVRTELAKAGKISQVGRVRSAGRSGSEPETK